MEAISVDIGSIPLEGRLDIPAHAGGLVVFAHGSGSSRLSPRNMRVAQFLAQQGLGTLLFDLLSEVEARDRTNVFDIELLGRRVVEAIDWVAAEPELAALPLGVFGASTGAAAALVAAVHRPDRIAAVVSRGGRPDLAGTALAGVRCPTLLIVGGNDDVVIELNRDAMTMLACEKELVIIPGATHLFEEPGTLEQVMAAAADWFTAHLKRAAP